MITFVKQHWEPFLAFVAGVICAFLLRYLGPMFVMFCLPLCMVICVIIYDKFYRRKEK